MDGGRDGWMQGGREGGMEGGRTRVSKRRGAWWSAGSVYPALNAQGKMCDITSSLAPGRH